MQFSRVPTSEPMRARWSHKRKLVGRKWDLVLSEAQGQSIPWTKIGG